MFVGSEDDFEDFIPLEGLSEPLLSNEGVQFLANLGVHECETLGVLG